MSVSPEELMAFADGELDPRREAEVAAAVAADPALAEGVRAHRALRERLGAHFAPIMEEPVPERLTALLRPEPKVLDLAASRGSRERKRQLPRWSWIAGPALAASVALAVLLPGGGSGDYAGGQLAAALDDQLVATQPGDAPTRILLSFRDPAGNYCRAFTGEAQSGIACRDAEGWRIRMVEAGAAAQQGDFRMASAPAAVVLERAQTMADGPALDSAQERTARASGWR